MDYENRTWINITETLENVTNATFSRNEDLARVEVVVQTVIFILAVIGNTTVLVSLYHKRTSLSRMHHLMVHLCIADLFVAFGSVLPQLAWDITYVFKGGDVLCRLVKYMQIVAIYASAYVLVMTAVDRYFAICLPLTSHKWSNGTGRKMVITAWTLSLVFSTPQLFIFSYKLNGYGMYDCWATFEPKWTLTVYITMFTILVYIIPTLILIFCYTSICLIVWKSARVGERLGSVPCQIPLKELKEEENNGLEQRNGDVMSSANPLILTPPDNEGNSQTKTYHFTDKTFHTHDKSFLNANNPHVCLVNKSASCGAINDRASSRSFNFIPRSPNIGRATNFGRSPIKRRSPTNDRPSNHERQHVGHGISRAKIRTIKLTLTVVICYLACWSPFFIAQMWAVYDTNAPFYGSAYTIILLLASLNSCTNPWIYLIFSESFLSEFKRRSMTLTRAIRCR